ncbi:MAG: restriction endonuclease subunit S [Erysipelotrichaceae bacterium]|nr:restriction endonuclease subunit S [Erysipelotrichaceae bacterium]
MAENILKPQIRFKGFTDSWEQRKVCEISNRFDNLRIPVSSSLRIEGETPYYGANGIQDYVDGFTHDGEFVLVAEDGANDLKNYPVQYVNGRIWVNNHAHVLQSNKENETLFLKYLINSADIESLLVGGGRAKLNSEVLMNMDLIVPNKNEQKNISSLLINFDSLITLHQRKYEKLQNIKKGLLEKMFPAGEECKPQIRFKGFTDSWEQYKFNQIMDTVTDFVAAGSFADMAENVVYESLPDYAQLVRTTDLKSNFSNNNFVYVNKKAFDFLWRVNLDTESIIMPNIGNCGEIYYVNQEILPYKHNVLGPNAILVRSENQNNKFLSVSFLSDDFQRKLKLIVSPNGQTKFNKTELKTLDVIIPSVKEQIKVGTLFDSLDSLITLHQRKCEKLINIKKALLEKMFC